jgi:peptide/nickel transport system substrate-binding protein
MVTDWIAGDRVVMEANPNFTAGKPPIDTLIWKAIPETATRVSMIRDGTIDVAYDLLPSDYRALEGAPGVRVVNVQANRQDWVILQYKHPILSNKLVRQALNYAINREDIVETAYLEYAIPWRSATSSMFPGALPESEFPYYHDPDKARELLAEAGYPDGFEVELRYDAGTKQHETAGTLIQQYLDEVGITVNLKKVPSGVMGTDIISRNTPEMSLWHTSAMTFDINYALFLFYHNDSCCTWGDYDNPEIDAMIEEANTILDQEERFEAHYEIQRLLLEEAPLVYVAEWNHTVAIRDNVKGWNWWTQGECMMERLYFEGYTGEQVIWADEEAQAGQIGPWPYAPGTE